MKIKHALAILCLCCTPVLAIAQGNMLSGENDTIEIIKEPSIHPFDTTQAFVLGMQLTRHYYYTLSTINPHLGYTTYIDIYSDAQIVIQDFIQTPIRFPNIHFQSVEQYYGALLLLLYNEAHQRANDETRHKYERHLEAAVLYRTAYLIGAEYIEENQTEEDTEASTIPYILEQLDAQALSEEIYLANLIRPEPTQDTPRAFRAPPNTPENLLEDDLDDLPELEPIDEHPDIMEHLPRQAFHITWPPNEETLRNLIFGELANINAEGSML